MRFLEAKCPDALHSLWQLSPRPQCPPSAREGSLGPGFQLSLGPAAQTWLLGLLSKVHKELSEVQLIHELPANCILGAEHW